MLAISFIYCFLWGFFGQCNYVMNHIPSLQFGSTIFTEQKILLRLRLIKTLCWPVHFCLKRIVSENYECRQTTWNWGSSTSLDLQHWRFHNFQHNRFLSWTFGTLKYLENVYYKEIVFKFTEHQNHMNL